MNATYVLAAFGIALNAWGYYNQQRAVNAANAGQAVSVSWFAGLLASSIAGLIYGSAQGDGWFMANALTCLIGQILVIKKLHQYKEWSRWDRVACVTLSLLIVTAVATRYKDGVVLAISCLNGISYFAQHKELEQSGNTGSLMFGPMAAFTASSAIWTWYGFHHGWPGPAISYAGFGVSQIILAARWQTKRRTKT